MYFQDSGSCLVHIYFIEHEQNPGLQLFSNHGLTVKKFYEASVYPLEQADPGPFWLLFLYLSFLHVYFLLLSFYAGYLFVYMAFPTQNAISLFGFFNIACLD